MNYNLAKKVHKEQWQNGKHKNTNEDYVFPYNLHYKNDTFKEIEILISECELQETSNILVNKYLELNLLGINLGPSWAIVGKKLQNGDVQTFWHNKYYVVDGNHRLQAKIKQGILTTTVIMPISNYNEYKRIYNE